MKILKISDYSRDNFPFVLNEPGRQPDYPWHEHEFTELVIVHNGHGVNVISGHEYMISAGDIFVVKKSLPHKYCHTSGLSISSLLLNMDELPLPFEMLRRLPGYHSMFEVEPGLRRERACKSRLNVDSEQMNIVEGMLSRIRLECHDKRSGYEAATVAMLTELIVFLARAYSEQSHGNNMETVSRLGEVISRMETNYRHDWSLEELVASAHMSKRSFIRYFNSVYNMPPIKYLLQIRLRKASEMLRFSDKPISAVAAECGFDDSNYFSRHFKKSVGMSPREYRNLHASK